jgi:branched-subunit amino acid transport protein AzlD
MSPKQLFFAILIIALVTFFTRVFPFLFFRQNREIPPNIAYLGHYLPPAIITIILAYCFKSVRLNAAPYGLPELVAALTVVVLHLWRHNFLLSILGGTLLYIVLFQSMGA